MTFGIDVFGATSYTNLQAEVHFNAPIKSGHASGMIGNQSNHPEGNPSLEDTWIIAVNQYNKSSIRAGPAKYQPCPNCNPPLPDWRMHPHQGSNFSSLDGAKSYVEDLNKYWIDQVSPKTTTTSGRSSSTKSKKSKSTQKKSAWKKLRSRFKW